MERDEDLEGYVRDIFGCYGKGTGFVLSLMTSARYDIFLICSRVGCSSSPRTEQISFRNRSITES